MYTEDDFFELAKDMYRAYGQVTEFKNYQGLPMPEWDNLTDTIKRAWVNAGKAAAAKFLEDINSKFPLYMREWRKTANE